MRFDLSEGGTAYTLLSLFFKKVYWLSSTVQTPALGASGSDEPNQPEGLSSGFIASTGDRMPKLESRGGCAQ